MSLLRVTPSKLLFSLLASTLFLLSPLAKGDSLSQQTLLESAVERLKQTAFLSITILASDNGCLRRQDYP